MLGKCSYFDKVRRPRAQLPRAPAQSALAGLPRSNRGSQPRMRCARDDDAVVEAKINTRGGELEQLRAVPGEL